MIHYKTRSLNIFLRTTGTEVKDYPKGIFIIHTNSIKKRKIMNNVIVLLDSQTCMYLQRHTLMRYFIQYYYHRLEHGKREANRWQIN